MKIFKIGKLFVRRRFLTR